MLGRLILAAGFFWCIAAAIAVVLMVVTRDLGYLF